MRPIVGVPKSMVNLARLLAAALVVAAADLLVWPAPVAYAHGESIAVTPLEAKPN